MRLIGKAREFSFEFPVLLSNHLPMVLVCPAPDGATDARLNEFFEFYRVTNTLVPPPPSVAQIKQDHWSEALGDRTRETDYRAFFVNEVTRRGANAVIGTYMPTLIRVSPPARSTR